MQPQGGEFKVTVFWCILLYLPECLWSASQCLTTRVCGPWYLSLSITEEQLLPPDGQCSGQQYWRGYDLYFTWTLTFSILQLTLWSLLERLFSTSVMHLRQTDLHTGTKAYSDLWYKLWRFSATFMLKNQWMYKCINVYMWKCTWLYIWDVLNNLFSPVHCALLICHLYLRVNDTSKKNPMDNRDE